MNIRMYRRPQILLIITFCVWPSICFPQDFLEGMNLFNRAQYDSLIQSYVPQFVSQHPDQQGVARYFSAESYYNKAMAVSQVEQIETLMRQAWNEFTEARRFSDLKTDFTEYHHFAKYKMGWCSYRLAELSDEPIGLLQRAYAEFMDVEPTAPDSLRIFSYYMAAKTKTRENLLTLYKLSDREFQTGEFEDIIGSYREIQAAYDQIINAAPSTSSPENLSDLQAISAIEKESVKYHLGKWHQVLSYLATDQDVHLGERDKLGQTLRSYSQQDEGESVFTQNLALRNSRPVVAYLAMMGLLQEYMLTGSDRTKESIRQQLDGISGLGSLVERNFRRGNLYHSHPDVTSVEFNELAEASYLASKDISESYYWLGYLQMIQNAPDQSRASFLKFINAFDKNRMTSDRRIILYEDAQFRKHLLDFEAYYLSNNFKRLRTLAEGIESFSPKSPLVQKRKELPNVLVNCSLTKNASQLRSKVLTGSDTEKLEQAFSTIKFILPRAALTIGVTREKYITLLNRLFEVTNTNRSDETRFFRGMVKALEAEIQANPVEKSRAFKQAATILSLISSDYVNKDEADYLRANCLFFADEFEEAETALQRLVNRKKYLRALFYLAEIYRLSDRGLAAKKCYQVIIDKFKSTVDEFDRYWLLNARAGLSSSEDDGDLEVLRGINIRDVAFQPNLRHRQLTYEKLADERYLQQQYARESVNWLAHFGLPKKEIYPSRHRLPGSVFVAENIFEEFPPVIDEVRGRVTSTLKLAIVFPDRVVPQCEVRLNDEILHPSDSVYIRKSIPLNSVHDLVVKHDSCYPAKHTLRFSKAGENFKVVVLAKKLSYLEKQLSKNIFDDFDYSFASRWDQNYIFNKEIPKQVHNSDLVRDFASSYQLRDCALDKSGNRILAINAAENSIWIYSPSETSKRVGLLELRGVKGLNSPEGIAVDSEGSIFVADWGNHRILEFSNDGELTRVFGSLGENGSSNIGEAIKLVFPTRIAVLEDLKGVNHIGRQYYREKYLFVADQNGIHILNRNGD